MTSLLTQDFRFQLEYGVVENQNWLSAHAQKLTIGIGISPAGRRVGFEIGVSYSSMAVGKMAKQLKGALQVLPMTIWTNAESRLPLYSFPTAYIQ